MQNIFTKKITSKRTIKAVLIAVGMGIGFIVFGGIVLLSLYLGDKYIYDEFYTNIFQEPVWYIFLSLAFVITSLLGMWFVFKVKKIKTNNKSFTLIELLVVIAIIGVLSAIIITSMSNAVTKSRIVRLQIFSDTIRAQLSDSLVSWWSFNEGTGTTAYDQWEGNNGTLHGDPTWKSGGDCVSGSCLEFDGSGDYVDINQDLLDGACSGTVMLWIKRGDWLVRYSTIFSKSNGGSWVNNHIQIARNSYDDILHLTISDNISSTYGNVLTGVIEKDKWHLISMTWNGTILKGHQDGILVDYYNTSICLPSNSTKVVVAKGAAGTDRYFNGLIDEVRIYNSAATITQIQSQYLAGLDKLLSNGAISKSEYNQRIKKLSKEIVIE